MKPLVYIRGDDVVEQKVVHLEITSLYTDESQKFNRANPANPFILYLAHTMPHTPIAARERYKGTSAGAI